MAGSPAADGTSQSTNSEATSAKRAQRRSSGATDAPARKRLIEATVALLRTSGSVSVTSRAVADEAGENLGAITYYFGSKDNLVNEAMIAVAEDLIRPVIDEMVKPDVEPSTALFVGIQMLHNVLAENRQQIPAYLHSLAAASTSETLAGPMAELHQSLTASLASLIEAYRRDGVAADWVDPVGMAQVITAVVHGVAMSVAVEDAAGLNQTDPTKVAGQFGQLLLNAGPGGRGT